MSKKHTYYQLNPQIYDDQFWWKKDDIEFWKDILNPTSNTILEIAAGTGRLAEPLIREGFDYTGLEISDEYCRHANRKLQEISDKQFVIQGDMRNFNLDKKYDRVFIPFNSLLHILNENDLLITFKNIRKHMHSNSKLFIDIFFPHPEHLINSRNLEKRVEFFNSINKKETIIKEKILYNSDTEIIQVSWFYENNNKIYKEFFFDMKIYYPDTMNRILVDSGFEVLNIWGDYNKSILTELSNLQIYKCQI